VRASHIVLLAIVLKLLGRWAHNEPTLSVGTIFGAIFVLIVVGMMDSSNTEPIAKGVAWLILAAVLLANDSIVPALGRLIASNEPL
jgi:hypothetical protein